MPNKLDKHYNDFGGIDTRTNKFNQDPKTARAGKNFVFSPDDEIAKRFGFQTVADSGASEGLIEYKYTDSLTGESLSKILGVDSSGYLNILKKLRVKFNSSGSAVSSISIYNDSTNYYIAFFNSSLVELQKITFSQATTLTSLLTSINGLIPSFSVEIIDEDGASSVSSSELAYKMMCWKNKEITTFVENEVSYFQRVPSPSSSVHFPEIPDRATKDPDFEGISYVNLNNSCYLTSGGFVMKFDGKTVYRAGLPKVMAVDYASGSIKPRNMSGFLLERYTNGGGFNLGAGYYAYRFQYFSTDANGLQISSKYDTSLGDMTILCNAGDNVKITLPKITNDSRFPIYSAIAKKRIKTPVTVSRNANVATIDFGGPHGISIGEEIKVSIDITSFNSSDATYPGTFTVTGSTFSSISYSNTGSNLGSTSCTGTVIQWVGIDFAENSPATIEVESGHNIKVGMYLKWPIYTKFGSCVNNHQRAMARPLYFFTEVTAVTSTSITTTKGFNTNGNIGEWQGTIYPGAVLSAQYYPDDLEGKNNGVLPEPLTNFDTIASGVRVWRSKAFSVLADNLDANDVYINDFYLVGEYSISHQEDVVIYDDFNDSYLSSRALASSDQGDDLPRACKYLSSWLDLIVQGGRPYKYISDTNLDYKNLPYPSFRSSLAPILPGSTNSHGIEKETTYSEVHLCDFQSVYWSDASNYEGFSQSGLAETRIDSVFNDAVSGFASNKDSFFVFKDRTCALLTGTPSTGDVSVEVLEADIGCSSHNSIQEINGSLVWLDGVNGFASCVAGRLPILIGYNINNFMRENYKLQNSQKLRFKAAKSCNFRLKDMYLCYVPCGTIDFDGSTSVPTPNSESIVFVFDYSEATMGQIRRCWYLWKDLNFKGGLLTFKDSIYASSTNLMKNRNSNSSYDFSDNLTPITFQYKSSWLHYGYPSIDKHFIQWAINSVLGGFSLSVKQHGNFVDNEISSIDVNFKDYSSSKLQTKQTIKCPVPKLCSSSVEFYNSTINEGVYINGFEVQVASDFDMEEVKYG